MRMRVCYPDCHEAGLCYYYLVIHIENLLRLLQRFSSICDLFADSPSCFSTAFQPDTHCATDGAVCEEQIERWSVTDSMSVSNETRLR
jgi:hypothetical protein